MATRLVDDEDCDECREEVDYTHNGSSSITGDVYATEY